MHTNLRHTVNAILVVGLLLTTSIVSYVSSTRLIPSETPASRQPVLRVSPEMVEFLLATGESDVLEPAPTVFVVPSPTSTPETLTLALEVDQRGRQQQRE